MHSQMILKPVRVCAKPMDTVSYLFSAVLALPPLQGGAKRFFEAKCLETTHSSSYRFLGTEKQRSVRPLPGAKPATASQKYHLSPCFMSSSLSLRGWWI